MTSALPPELLELGRRFQAMAPEQREAALAAMKPDQAAALVQAVQANPLLKATVGSTFVPTEKQLEARALLVAPELRFVLLAGGSRSGKTTEALRFIVERAIMAPESRHLLARHRFNAANVSLWQDSLPKVLRTCFPGLPVQWHRGDFFIELENRSQVWIGGLDSDDRAERILGTEYATVFLEEASQIPFKSAEMAMTRCNQKTAVPQKIILAENPPTVAHWTYRTFVLGREALSPHGPLKNRERYGWIRINPIHNAANLDPAFLEDLQSRTARQKLRFYDGEFGDAGEAALWSLETIETYRVKRAPVDLLRILVGVDPSGTKGDGEGDEIGIVAVGLGVDGIAYVLEDASVRAGPAVWGRVVVSCVERWDADCVVAETNFGGAMVERVVKAAAAEANVRVGYKEARASKGKVARAEPIATLYEQGKVRHVGVHHELEDQLVSFSTRGYLGDGSPDRADAAIWACDELFPRVTQSAERRERRERTPRVLLAPPGGTNYLRYGYTGGNHAMSPAKRRQLGQGDRHGDVSIFDIPPPPRPTPAPPPVPQPPWKGMKQLNPKTGQLEDLEE